MALAFGLTSCGSSTESPASDQTLRGAFGNFPDYLDPALAGSLEAATALQATYIPLLTYAHANGQGAARLIPGLAKALPRITDGGRTYTLQLRPGLRYSDGKPVLASDFKHAIERVLRLDSAGSPFYSDIVGAERFATTMHGAVRGIETDDSTGEIVIHLIKPRGTFSNELGLRFAAPVPAGTPAEDLSANPPPATGPYVITKVTPGRSWEYRRNPYWAKANAKAMPDQPGGHVARIEADVIHNPETEVNEVERETYDWMQNPPPTDRLAELQSKYAGTQLRTEPTISTYYFWLNTTTPPFDDVAVRRAVNYAVNPAALRRIYAGAMLPSQQILPVGMPGHRKFEPYPYNLAKARRLIAQADPPDRAITVWTDNASPNNEAGEYFQDVLRKLGFQVDLKVIDSSSYFTVIGNTSTPDLDAGWANWFEDYPHPNDYFQPQLAGDSIQPTNNTNWAQFDDPSLNAKIASLGAQQLGPMQEAEYAALDRAYMARAPWAPFGTLTSSTFVSSAVDFDKLIVNPVYGQDLTSFQLK
ncbi:MAG: ABC transporter substrate-binding protein [Solirubrobacterales bacterium]|nr:ABC transporter substrate-binding protein [Solirubrobacterales bacterium]